MKTIQPALWLRQETDSTDAIGSVVPSQYDSFARVFNPVRSPGSAALQWREIAARCGLTINPGTQWASISSCRLPGEQQGQPFEGDLEDNLASELAAVLSRHTGAGPWWSAIWVGYAENAGLSETSPTIVLPPDRAMLVRQINAATFDHRPKDQRLPIRFWPDDHAWCVGADIYSRSILIGGSQACINDLMSQPRIEAIAVARNKSPSIEDL